MISKTTIKLIKSLAQKKYRKQNNLFVAESPKLVKDILSGRFQLAELFVTEEYANDFKDYAKKMNLVSYDELEKVSFLEHPQGVLALLEIPEPENFPSPVNQLIVALDSLQDPGNMGTIIRLAHWFGVEHLVCSETCVDVYNSKVVQASMGALAYVNVHYTSLHQFLTQYAKQVPVYGALMNGKNIYQTELNSTGIVLLGNEGNGINIELLPLVNFPVSIPDYPQNSAKVDSLNVSMAASIILSEFRRVQFLRS